MTANADEPGQPVLLRCNASCDSEREPVLLPVGEVGEGATRGLELHWVSNACQSRAILTALNISFNAETRFSDVSPDYETQENLDARPFLIVEGPIVLGGGSFCLRTPTQGDTVFSFQWVWLFPAARGQGVYAAIHPRLTGRFGLFYAERPLSAAMENFLRINDQDILDFSEAGLPMGPCPRCQQIVFLSDQFGSQVAAGFSSYWHMHCPDA